MRFQMRCRHITISRGVYFRVQASTHILYDPENLTMHDQQRAAIMSSSESVNGTEQYLHNTSILVDLWCEQLEAM